MEVAVPHSRTIELSPLSDLHREFCNSAVGESTLLSCFESVIPAFGDWLVVELCNKSESLRDPWILHRDPAELSQRGLTNILRLNHFWESIKPETSSCSDQNFLKRISRDSAHQAELEKLNFSSYVSLPLISPTHMWGWLTIFNVQNSDIIEINKAKAFASCAASMFDFAFEKFKCELLVDRKNKFVSMVSHELRAPLNITLGWTTLLLDKPDIDPETKSALEIIYRNTREQADIISNLLDSTRIDLGKLILDFKDIHAPTFIEQNLKALSVIAKDKGVQLRCQIEAPFARVTADPIRLHQVLQNLVVNAIKFTPSGGNVTVKLEEDLRHILVSVRDTGEGIAHDFLPQVFERFKQRLGKKTYQPGLGLGLSIVKELVHAHGGEVSAHSDGPSRGATFTIKLPKKKGSTDSSNVIH